MLVTVVLGPPLLLGAVLALQLLDERDQNTLAALRVTPVPPRTYPAYQAGVTAALTAVSVLASLAVSLRRRRLLALRRGRPALQRPGRRRAPARGHPAVAMKVLVLLRRIGAG